MPHYRIFSPQGTIEIFEHTSSEIMLTCDGVQRIVSESAFTKTVKPFLLQLEAGKRKSLQLQAHSASRAFEQLKTCYDQFIVAAGGLVKNDRGELLLIFRHGKWDLPKGKVEAHEQTDTAAVREVREETGLQKIALLSEFQRTYHTYVQGGKRVLKETVWYLMRAQSGALVPQHDEGITRVEWVGEGASKEVYRNTYDNILFLLKSYYHHA